MKLPLLEKTVDGIVGNWLIFGEHFDGTVDVSFHTRSRQGDVFEGLPREVAEKVVEAHDRFLQELYQILC